MSLKGRQTLGLLYQQLSCQEGLTSVLEGLEEEGFSGSQYCVMQRSCNTFSEVPVVLSLSWYHSTLGNSLQGTSSQKYHKIPIKMVFKTTYMLPNAADF